MTEDWYFVSHRLPMARAARDAGFEVAVATRVGDHRAQIENEGMRVIDIGLDRGSLGLVREIAALRQITALYRAERPDIVHHVALKPTVYGSLAARIAGVPRVVNAMAGLGFLYASDRLLARLARRPAAAVFRFLFNRPGSVLVLQNDDDVRLFADAGIAAPERIVRIRGSGVDLARFAAVGDPPADGPIVAAYVGRMIEDKGLATLVAAQRILRRRGIALSLLLCGTPDPENPGAIDEATLGAWASEPGIEWLGHVDDIPGLWARAHIAVLASRREGLPLGLLEAAAAGRAIVASDVPGCREVAREGENALLFPYGDAAAAAEALATLAQDPGLRSRFAQRSREIVRSDLAAEAVGRRIVALYRELLAAPAGRGRG